jgi:aminoglycoside phosphotransferase (APT) family kinase protein
VAVKITAPAAAAREAAALTRLAGHDLAPELVAHGDGVLATTLVGGDVRPLASLSAQQSRALGAALARLHALERSDEGGYDGWDVPARSMDEYRRRRAQEIRDGASDAVAAALATASAPAPHASPAGPPFVLVHGDLWGGNIVWEGTRPTLVDWEFQRMGDPAEDLAYAVAMDDVPDDLVTALLEGYGRPDLMTAIRWWRPLLAADCARWYAAEGDAERAATLEAEALRLIRG